MENTALHLTLHRSDMRRLRNKKRRQRQLQRNVFISIITCILVLSLSIAFGSILTHAQSGDTVAVCKYYTSIEVRHGESLWSIAEQNMDDLQYDHYDDIPDYIDEILKINHLSAEDQIIAGQYLIIPYYAAEYM